MKGIITIQILSEVQSGDPFPAERLRMHADKIRDHIRTMPQSDWTPWDMEVAVIRVTDEAGQPMPGRLTMTEVALDVVRETFERKDTV